jgi:hypothetical protein
MRKISYVGSRDPQYVVPRRSIAGDERLLWGRIEPTGRSQAKVRQGPTRRSAYESAARLRHVLLDATPIFGGEPCEALLASPFRPRLGVRSGWSPFPKDSSYGQTTR